MRVVFMGTPGFAVPSLQALVAQTEVVAVFTRPDAISGRGRHARRSPAADAALALGIPLFQPLSLRGGDAVADLVELAPDILVVAAYGLILPRAVLDVAPLGAVNVHASLLPRWRGAAPVQRAILAGDAEVGISIMRMEVGLDTGPYCLQAAMPVGDADAVTLTIRLAELGATALVEALPTIASGSARWTPQNEDCATYADKISKDDVKLSPDVTAELAVRRIRASSSAAPCRVSLAGRGVTLLEASLAVGNVVGSPAPGSIGCYRKGVLLGVEDGAVLVTRLKPDGKSAMAASDWARGVRDLGVSTWDTMQ